MERTEKVRITFSTAVKSLHEINNFDDTNNNLPLHLRNCLFIFQGRVPVHHGKAAYFLELSGQLVLGVSLFVPYYK
jgi:hypothetical protein